MRGRPLTGRPLHSRTASNWAVTVETRLAPRTRGDSDSPDPPGPPPLYPAPPGVAACPRLLLSSAPGAPGPTNLPSPCRPQRGSPLVRAVFKLLELSCHHASHGVMMGSRSPRSRRYLSPGPGEALIMPDSELEARKARMTARSKRRGQLVQVPLRQSRASWWRSSASGSAGAAGTSIG